MTGRDTSGGELGEVPNTNYIKFFERFKEIETLPVNQWRPVHVIGWFCYLFQQTYDATYQFKFNSSAPSKCFEIFQIKKLGQVLSAKPDILKNYIEWIFSEKAVKEKIKFRSISFLTREEVVREYKLRVLLSSKIDRTTPLPANVKACFAIISEPYISGTIATYGDLAFLQEVVRSKSCSAELADLFQWCMSGAITQGFNKTILSEIK